jgi:hypothetical protein
VKAKLKLGLASLLARGVAVSSEYRAAGTGGFGRTSYTCITVRLLARPRDRGAGLRGGAERFLEAAGQLDADRRSIPSGRDLTRNPYDQRRGPNAVGVYGSGNKAIIGSGRPQLFTKQTRRRSWK